MNNASGQRGGDSKKRRREETTPKNATNSKAQGKKKLGMTGKKRKKERQEKKKGNDLLSETKQVWESLRKKEMPKNEREELTTRLLELCKGKMMEIINKHDGSRIIQCLIKFGNQQQLDAVIQELSGQMVSLSKSAYARHLVLAILRNGTKVQRDSVLKEFHGHVRQLVRHKEASEVLEYAYTDVANNKQKAALLAEFYGPQYALFHAGQTLDEVLKEKPDQQDTIMRYLGETVSSIVQKGLLSHTITHRILFDYLKYIRPTEIKDMVTSLKDQVVHILHTKEGSNIGVWCATYGSPKDRKAIIKSFKGHVNKIAVEEYGHHVLLRLIDVTDDTVLVKKALFAELLKEKEETMDVMGNKSGRLIWLHVLAPGSRTYFHPNTLALLQPAMFPATSSDKEPVPTSKKPLEQRRKEILDGVIGDLVELILSDAATVRTFLTSQYHSQIFSESIRHAPEDKKQALITTLVDACKVKEDSSPIDDFIGSRLLKRLIQQDEAIAEALWAGVSEHALHWVSKKGASFVIEALLKSPKTHKQVKANLMGHLDSLQKIEQGAAPLIVKALQEEGN